MPTLDDIRSVVRHELEDRSSLKKNGHSWKQWVGKIVTPERVMLVALGLMTLGGNIKEAQRNLADAVERATKATTLATEATKAATQATDEARATTIAIAQLQQELATVSKNVNDRAARGITRTEFQQAMQQQILPRLARIEQQLGQMK